MKTKKLNILCIAALLLGAVGAIGFVQTPVYAISEDKAFEYTISNAESGLKVVGEFEDGRTYTVSEGTSLQNVMTVIDHDRLVGGLWQDASIFFDDVVVGDAYLNLTRGNVELSGSLSGLGYSTFGLIYVNGANVVIENADFENAGISYLVKVEGAGDVTIKSGTLKAESNAIYSKGSGNITILGGEIVSQNDVAVKMEPSVSHATLAVSGVARVVANGSQMPAISVKNACVQIGGGQIVSGYAAEAGMRAQNSTVWVFGEPRFLGAKVAISTNWAISASFNGEPYAGQAIKILYSAEPVDGKTVLVQNATEENKDLFVVANERFKFGAGSGNLVMHRTYTLTYVDARGLFISHPVADDTYFAGQSVNVFVPEERDFRAGALERFEFLGWSLSPDAIAGTFWQGNSTIAFAKEDIVLYAVWRAKVFSITYTEVYDATNENPDFYTADDVISFKAPQKEFYVFKGWRVNGGACQEVLYLPRGSAGNLTLEAVWDFAEYNIVWDGVPAEKLEELGLRTTYTIDSSPMQIRVQDLLASGYSVYGVFFDEERTQAAVGTIHFAIDEQDRNSQSFLLNNQVGRDITLYVDMARYSTGVGDGSEENPYLINDFEQLKALVSGLKAPRTEPVHVALASDIVCDESFGSEFVALENVVVDGDGYLITANQLTEAGGYRALFPIVKNCQISNLYVHNGSYTANVGTETSVASLAGLIENSEIDGLNISGRFELIADGVEEALTMKFGSLCVEAKNCEFNDVVASCNFTASLNNLKADANVYGAGLVGFSANNCKFVNCEFTNEISTSIETTDFEVRAYISGLVAMGTGNEILNCLSSAQLNLSQSKTNNNAVIMCGVAMPFGTGNVLKSVAQMGAITATEDSENVYSYPIAPKSGAKVTNAFTAADFEENQQKTLKALLASLDGLKHETNKQLKTWFFDENGKLQFTTGLFVQFVGGELFKTMNIYFANPEDAQNKAFYYDASKYRFKGWLTESGQAVDWENLDSPSIIVKADYDYVDDLILFEQIMVVVVDVLIVLAVIGLMAVFDMPKTVRFIKNGRLVDAKKYPRRAKVELPPDFRRKMCFVDVDGKKPFVKQVMPFHALDVYIFDNKKQKRLEEYWNAVAARKAEKLAKKLETKKTTQIKDAKNQTPLKAGEDSKITIIKKEIKVITSDDKTEE